MLYEGSSVSKLSYPQEYKIIILTSYFNHIYKSLRLSPTELLFVRYGNDNGYAAIQASTYGTCEQKMFAFSQPILCACHFTYSGLCKYRLLSFAY